MLCVAVITWYIISSYVATGVPMTGTGTGNKIKAEMISNGVDKGGKGRDEGRDRMTGRAREKEG